MMEVLLKPAKTTRKGACNSKGCKNYTCIYHLFGKKKIEKIMGQCKI